LRFRRYHDAGVPGFQPRADEVAERVQQKRVRLVELNEVFGVTPYALTGARRELFDSDVATPLLNYFTSKHLIIDCCSQGSLRRKSLSILNPQNQEGTMASHENARLFCFSLFVVSNRCKIRV
jgi:hypothetical protein